MTFSRTAISTLAVALVSVFIFSTSAFAGALGLIEDQVRRSYPAVQHVVPDNLGVGSGDESEPLLVDVREAGEFAVSHLPGAIRIDPEAAPADVLARLGEVSGRRIIFYCSVGMRSSKLAEIVREDLTARGAASVENLSGGIFRWHNEKRRLVRGDEETDAVHPYSAFWSVLLSRRQAITYSPKP